MPDLKIFMNGSSEEGEWLNLVNPYTEEYFDPPMQIKLLGLDSGAYKNVSKKQINRRANIATRRMRKNNYNVYDHDEVLEDTLQILSACTVEWRNFEFGEDSEGVPIPLEFNPENVTWVYTEFDWIREQAELFINDRANFLANGKTP